MENVVVAKTQATSDIDDKVMEGDERHRAEQGKRVVLTKYIPFLCFVLMLGFLNPMWWKRPLLPLGKQLRNPSFDNIGGSLAPYKDVPSNATTTQADNNNKKPILFVHFHKSGGTSVCEIMKKAHSTSPVMGKSRLPESSSRDREGELLQTPMVNCNIPPEGPNYDIQKDYQWQTCQHVSDYAVRHDHTVFFAVEIPLKESMPCPGLRSMAIMRKPVERVLSHIKFEHVSPTIVQQWIASRASNSFKSYINGYPVINNMVIRQLLGRDRFSNSIIPIGLDDYHRAKEVVDMFDVFVPLEYLSHPNVQQLLKNKVPEYYSSFVQHGESGYIANMAKTANRAIAPSQELLQQIAQENVYDQMLYDYILVKLGINETQSA